MKHLTRSAVPGVTLLTLALIALGVNLSGQSAGNPLIGVWQVTEIANPNAAPITSPQPSLYVFTKGHYNFTRINGTKPLPPYPSNDKATPEEKVAVFDVLLLQAGTYAVSGNTFSTKTTVAKSAFGVGGTGQYEFAVTGNTLVLTQRPSGAVTKLTRLE